MEWPKLAATSINATSSAVTADNDLRVVSVTIAAYECVMIGFRSRPLVGTHTRLLVISSPSLRHTGCINPLIAKSERVHARNESLTSLRRQGIARVSYCLFFFGRPSHFVDCVAFSHSLQPRKHNCPGCQQCGLFLPRIYAKILRPFPLGCSRIQRYGFTST